VSGGVAAQAREARRPAGALLVFDLSMNVTAKK